MEGTVVENCQLLSKNVPVDTEENRETCQDTGIHVTNRSQGFLNTRKKR
jgi:tartrate dehydratase alpha subunit/fumarate hydratase class I-like protein